MHRIADMENCQSIYRLRFMKETGLYVFVIVCLCAASCLFCLSFPVSCLYACCCFCNIVVLSHSSAFVEVHHPESLISSFLPSLCPSAGLGLKRPYEDGMMDDKDLIKKMKRNLRKGTVRRQRTSMSDCSVMFICANDQLLLSTNKFHSSSPCLYLFLFVCLVLFYLPSIPWRKIDQTT